MGPHDLVSSYLHRLAPKILGKLIAELAGPWQAQQQPVLVVRPGPGRTTRLNTVYFFTRFLGIAGGSALGAQLWAAWNWPAVSLLGLVGAGVALPVAVLSAPRRTKATGSDALVECSGCGDHVQSVRWHLIGLAPLCPKTANSPASGQSMRPASA
jgi:hypothetical protein